MMLKRISGELPMIVVMVLFIVVLPFASVFSQDDGYSGEPIWIYDSDLYVSHVEIADLNQDGTDDVIAGEYSSDYYGEPSIVFALNGETGDTLWTYQLQDGVRSMTIGDLNNDGIMDVIAGASYHSTNTPDGRVHAINGETGIALWTYYIGATIDGVTIADLNGDDYVDVAAASFDDYVYGIDGLTGAGLWSHLVRSMWVNDVDAGDVNGDGIDDVGYAHEYLAGYDNRCGVLDGTDGTIIWEDTVEYVVLDVLVSDIDSDGELEAIYSGAFADDHGAIFIRNAADGTIEWEHDLGYLEHVNGEITLFEFDIDDDGDLDLVVGNKIGSYYIYAFEGDVDEILWTSEALDGYPFDLAFGDVIGDGNLNIIASTWDRVQVVDVNTGLKVWYYGVAGTVISVGCADFDGDGISDVVAGGGANFSGTPPDPGESVWALKTVQSPLLWEFEFGEYGNAIALGDLNSDGCEDVITVCSLDDQAWAIDGITGEELWHWTGTENLYTVTTGDFNNDGQLDVAVAGYDQIVTALDGEDGSVMWQFTTPTQQIYRKCLQAMDVNGDDSVDVIAGARDNNVYAIHGGNGNQIWAQNVGGQVHEIELAQMNGIGPFDVVVAVGSGGEKVVVLDGADGEVIWDYAAPEAVAHVEVFDVNNDDILDVAAAIAPYNPKQIIMIDGNTHTALWSELLPIPSNVYGLGHGYLNGDNVPDLLVPGNSTDKKVYALSGDDGHELWSYQTNGEINCVVGYDVDGDGNCDAIVGSDDQKVYVIKGEDGSLSWDYTTVGDVMQLLIGDLNCNDLPNIVCVTFDSDGVVYAFRSLASGPGPGCDYIPGDANGDGNVMGNDVTYSVRYFKGLGASPPDSCWNTETEEWLYSGGDANGNCSYTGSDVTFLVGYFKGYNPEILYCPQTPPAGGLLLKSRNRYGRSTILK